MSTGDKNSPILLLNTTKYSNAPNEYISDLKKGYGETMKAHDVKLGKFEFEH